MKCLSRWWLSKMPTWKLRLKAMRFGLSWRAATMLTREDLLVYLYCEMGLL